MLRSKRKMNFIQKVWWLLTPFHQDLYRIFLITASFEFVRMGGPYLFSRILDLLVTTNGILSLQTIVLVVLGLAGMRIFAQVIDLLADFVVAKTSIAADRYTSTKAFEKLLNLSIDYHEKVSTGAKINIVGRGVDKLINLLDSYVWEFQPVCLQLIISAIIIFFLNWRLGTIFTLSLIPFVLITFKIFDFTKTLRVKRHDAYERSSGEMGDTISNITVVKAYAQESREHQSFGGIQGFIESITWREVKRLFFTGFGRNILVELFYGILFLIGLIEVGNQALTVGGLVFLINITERAYSNIHRLGKIYERAVDASESVDRITNLLSLKPTVTNAPNAIDPGEITGRVSFKHVTFAYRKKRVLKNLSFTIPAGSFTALVGKSGSGKSTIAKLLSRYYDPKKGSIVIDGRYDLKDLDIDAYRKNTAVVFQDSPVPNRKLWEIIAYSAGRVEFSSVKNRVLEAAKLSYADEFIKELPDGYQTEVGERGVKLSGGQRQRLAIARALFAQPKILIMDEPTSHLDTHSESLIQQALKDLSKERSFTKIIIAHRLSTVQNADQILVMEKGKMVEKGTHPQLLKKNGVYASIVRQSELKG